MDSPLVNKLAKDLTANGKKTALLGVLLIVGMFIWIPQLSRTFNSSAHYAVATPAPQIAPPSAISADPPASGEKPAWTWNQLSDWLEQGEYTRSIPPPSGTPNPFEGPKEEDPPQVTIQPVLDPLPPVTAPIQPSAPSANEYLPAPPTLVLKSTLQGKQMRGAVINDRYYSEGESIETDEATYILDQVEPRRVILRDGNQSFELLIPSVLPRSSRKLPPAAPLPEKSL